MFSVCRLKTISFSHHVTSSHFNLKYSKQTEGLPVYLSLSPGVTSWNIVITPGSIPGPASGAGHGSLGHMTLICRKHKNKWRKMDFYFEKTSCLCLLTGKDKLTCCLHFNNFLWNKVWGVFIYNFYKEFFLLSFWTWTYLQLLLWEVLEKI